MRLAVSGNIQDKTGLQYAARRFVRPAVAFWEDLKSQFLPKKLEIGQDIVFFEGFISTFRNPIVIGSLIGYYFLIVGISYAQSDFDYVLHWLAGSVAVMALTFTYVIVLWPRTRHWGYRRQLTVLNLLFALVGSSFGWSTVLSWYTMSEVYIAVMTIVISGILGAAVYIFAHSRISYLSFSLSWAFPGVVFMFSHSGGFHLFMGVLFLSGIASFIMLNFIEYAKQRQLFEFKHNMMNLNTELSRKDAELDQELQFASHIQVGIFPEPAAVHEPYTFHSTVLPLGRVSGDYCDIVLREGATFAIVADASGHGIPAALLTMAAKNVFSNLLTAETSPEQAFVDGNQEILKMIKTPDFMTAFMAKLYPTGRVEFSNAAHPPAIWQTNAGEIKMLDTSGFILGGLSDVDALYAKDNIQLSPGDRLFLYTDGIIESFNRDKKFYGMERLGKTLAETRSIPLAKVVPHMFSDLVTFSDGVPFHDDITMMVIEFNL